MASAAAELLAVAGVRGSVPTGGSSANPPPVVPAANPPGLLDCVFVVGPCDDDFLAWAKGRITLTINDVNNNTIVKIAV